MADNVAITAGLGTTISTEEVTTLNGGAVSAQHTQRVIVASRTADGVAVDADFTVGAEGAPAGGVSSVQSPGPAMTPLKTFPLPVTPVSGLTAAMTGTTSTAVTGIGAAGVGKFNYITSLVIGNSHATVGTFVELQDGNGGTTFFTVPAAAVYGGAVITFPTPLKQPTSNTALYCKDTTTGANVIVSASGFQA